MKTLSKLPDLANSARLLKISLDLEDIKEDNIFGYSIKKALREKKDLRGILQMIREQYQDNPDLLNKIMGQRLMEDINKVII